MQTVKGAQRRMVQMRIDNSRYYEEALFIVRKDLPRVSFPEGEMLAEANRILRESAGTPEAPKPHRVRSLVWFFGGVLLGFLAALAIFFLRFAS